MEEPRGCQDPKTLGSLEWTLGLPPLPHSAPGGRLPCSPWPSHPCDEQVPAHGQILVHKAGACWPHWSCQSRHALFHDHPARRQWAPGMLPVKRCTQWLDTSGEQGWGCSASDPYIMGPRKVFSGGAKGNLKDPFSGDLPLKPRCPMIFDSGGICVLLRKEAHSGLFKKSP